MEDKRFIVTGKEMLETFRQAVQIKELKEQLKAKEKECKKWKEKSTDLLNKSLELVRVGCKYKRKLERIRGIAQREIEDNRYNGNMLWKLVFYEIDEVLNEKA